MRMRGSAEYRTNGNVRIQIMMFAMFIQWSTSLRALHRESFLETSFFPCVCFEYKADPQIKQTFPSLSKPQNGDTLSFLQNTISFAQQKPQINRNKQAPRPSGRHNNGPLCPRKLCASFLRVCGNVPYKTHTHHRVILS